MGGRPRAPRCHGSGLNRFDANYIATRAANCPRPRIPDHPDLPACAGCGRCCHLVVELRAGDRVPAHLIAEHAGVACMDQRSDGACVALDPLTQLCTIYGTRPQTCRDFLRGETLCRRTLAHAAARRGTQNG